MPLANQDNESRSLNQQMDLQYALATLIGQRTVGMQDCATDVPNLSLFRRETPTRASSCLAEPSVVLVVQGAKRMLAGGETYTYDSEHFLITSLDLPATSQVLEATVDRPCLGLVFKLDLRLISEIIIQDIALVPRPRALDKCIGLGTITSTLLDPLLRLLRLLDEPESIPLLAPLIQKEMHYRLLKSDQATRLWQMASAGSQGQRVAKAIAWLKENYTLQLHIDQLAAHAQMSTTSLHHHFRQLVAMSPLQYQKWLRLNEARRIMLTEDKDAANAAFNVGYESPSQFSREYRRLFGAPPKRDIDALRRALSEKSSRSTQTDREYDWRPDLGGTQG